MPKTQKNSNNKSHNNLANLDQNLAELKLAILKENFSYREFFGKLKRDPYTICPEFRKPQENYDEYSSKIRHLKLTGFIFLGGYAEKFELYEYFIADVQKNESISTEDLLILLDPQKEISEVSSSKLIKKLPLLFYSEGVSEYGRTNGLVRNIKFRNQYISQTLDDIFSSNVAELSIPKVLLEKIYKRIETFKEIFPEQNSSIEFKEFNGKKYFRSKPIDTKLYNKSRPILDELLKEFKNHNISLKQFYLYIFKEIGAAAKQITKQFVEDTVRAEVPILKYQRYKSVIETDLYPYERLVKIDLRTKKSQLLEKLEEFIKEELYSQAAATKAAIKYDLGSVYQWTPDESRDRIDKAWKQLEVWKLRKDRKSFLQIARDLGIKEDTAKKRFYRAYELTQRKKYIPEHINELWTLKKEGLKKTCKNCSERKSCKEPCPDILKYIDQDEIKLKEKYLVPTYEKTIDTLIDEKELHFNKHRLNLFYKK